MAVIRIRRVVDDALREDARAIDEAVALFERAFSGAPDGEFQALATKLRDPFAAGFRTLLYLAEGARRGLRGAAIASVEPRIGIVVLDWITADPDETGGVGAALVERIREDASRLGTAGILLECLSDRPDEVPDAELLRQNVARLRFYERFGARPIVGTDYREPVEPGGARGPWLVFLPAEPDGALRRKAAREAVRAILERKYRSPPAYVERVVASFRDDPVRLRAPIQPPRHPPVVPERVAPSERVALVVHEGHQLHHVPERGYVEAPTRVDAVLAALLPSGLCERLPTASFPLRCITAVHDPAYVRWLKAATAEVAPGKRVYPYVFPVRNPTQPPEDLLLRAGYHCIDTFTPLHRELYGVVVGAAETALTAARALSGSRRIAYALVRPPGHHAERALYGGFCYLNNAAIAAQWLRDHGADRVALLDLDYHHGNGQQQIFWERSDVLTVSIHGHPRFAYPYFSGFADEIGAGAGEGFNLNLPLPEDADGARHRTALAAAVDRVAAFRPDALVVCLGLDTARGDPTGTWSLREPDFRRMGELVGALRRPTLVVQEGGYRLRSLGRAALAFFVGLHAEVYR